MKDQYFGDVNDFWKYSLLMRLSGGGTLRTGVCWMLTQPDGRTDGSALRYLSQPENFRHFEPSLFDLLHNAVVVGNDRRVGRIEDSGLLPNAIYHSPYLPDDKDGRCAYFRTSVSKFEHADWVFFDPDNGIEVPSITLGRMGSSKFLYWHEIVDSYQTGKSVFVYQHFPRKARLPYTEGLALTLRKQTAARIVFSYRTSRVVFFLAAQVRHEEHFRDCSARVIRHWGAQIIVSEHSEGFILPNTM